MSAGWTGTPLSTVDIGGGTSDFTVVRLGPQHHGTRADLARTCPAPRRAHRCTDFDHRLSLDNVMPLLGYRHRGVQQREVPSRVFFDLSTWHLIQWLYKPKRAIARARSAPATTPDPALRAAHEGAGAAPRTPRRA